VASRNSSESSSSLNTISKKEGVFDVEKQQNRKPTSIHISDVPFANNWFQEFAILFKRACIDMIRNKDFIIGSFARTVIMTCLIGFTFFRMSTDQQSVQNRIGILFFWPANLLFTTVIPIVTVLPLKRTIMMRERVARSYRVSTFFLSITVAEMLNVIFFTTLAVVPLYFMMALQLTASKFFYWYAIQISHVLAGAGLGIFIGAAVKTVDVGQIVAPLATVTFLLFGGVLINNNNLPAYFKWIQYLSPINYAYRGNMINEMSGLSLTCNVEPCYTQGQQILDYQDIAGIPIWACIVAELALCVGFSTLGYLALHKTSKIKLRL